MPGPRVSVYTPLGQVKIEYDSCPIFHFFTPGIPHPRWPIVYLQLFVFVQLFTYFQLFVYFHLIVYKTQISHLDTSNAESAQSKDV